MDGEMGCGRMRRSVLWDKMSSLGGGRDGFWDDREVSRVSKGGRSL